MATLAALIGGNLLAGIGGGIVEGFREQRRQKEWEQGFGLRERQQTFHENSTNRQLDLLGRGQNLNFYGGLASTGMNVGSSLIGNLLSYNHSSNLLDYQKQLNSQRREDLTNDGIPLSYLHLGGAGARLPNLPMQGVQTLGRNVVNTMNFANSSGQPLSNTFGPPPSYSDVFNGVPPAANSTPEITKADLRWSEA